MKRIKKKIALFSGYFVPHIGGVERYTEKLSIELSKLGFDVVVVTFNYPYSKNIEGNKYYKIYRLPIINLFRKRYPLPKINNEYRHLINEIEKENIDYFIVNTRFHLTSLIGSRIGKKLKKKVYLIEHGSSHLTVDNKVLDFFGSIYEHILTLIIKRYVDKYYGVSMKCNEWLEHFNIKASGVFYNSIDANISKADFIQYDDYFNKDDIIIAYAGRLVKEKGILNLLEAFNKIKFKYSNIRLVIAGDGPLNDKIKKEYNDDKIIFLGKISFDNVLSLFKRADIMVNPTILSEGMPTSILEAGLMECAIIATPKGGTTELIVNEDYGNIVDESAESISNKLIYLIDNKKVRMRQGKIISRHIRNNFSWEKCAKEIAHNLDN